MAILPVHVSHLSLVILARLSLFFYPMRESSILHLPTLGIDRDIPGWIIYSLSIVVLYAKHSRPCATIGKTDTIPVLMGHTVYSSAVQ